MVYFVIGGAVLALLALVGITVDVLDEGAEKKAQLSYEENLLRLYQEFSVRPENDNSDDKKYLPLLFKPEDIQDLFKMCKAFRSKLLIARYVMGLRKIKKYEHHTEVKSVAFRKLEESTRPKKPILVEMIRCSNELALVSIGNGFSGYLLEKVKDEKEKEKMKKQEKQEVEKKETSEEEQSGEQQKEEVFHIYRKFSYKKLLKGKSKKSPSQDDSKAPTEVSEATDRHN